MTPDPKKDRTADLKILAKKLFGDDSFSFRQAAQAVADAEYYTRNDAFSLNVKELSVLEKKTREGYKEKYGKYWRSMLPIVECEYRKAIRHAGLPPTGMNRAQRRAAAKGMNKTKTRFVYPPNVQKYLP